MNLTTNYMGLRLRNPIIVASCGLTGKVEGVRRCADAGAGAVVLKSLFQEQIESETKRIEQDLSEAWHPEAYEYVARLGKDLGPAGYLSLIREAKEAVSIPIIASLNCVSPTWWVDYAARIAEAGADALELNMAIMPSDPKRSGHEIEGAFFKIVEDITKRIDLPIAVKLGPYFTSVAWVARGLCERGVSGLVLFNRFYQFDIDLEKIELRPGNTFSTSAEMAMSLRCISLLSGKIDCDLAGATGIKIGAGVAKHLLAGAAAVQICSVSLNYPASILLVLYY